MRMTLFYNLRSPFSGERPSFILMIFLFLVEQKYILLALYVNSQPNELSFWDLLVFNVVSEPCLGGHMFKPP